MSSVSMSPSVPSSTFRSMKLITFAIISSACGALLLTTAKPSVAIRMSSRSSTSAIAALNWFCTRFVIERTTCRLSLSDMLPSSNSVTRATPIVIVMASSGSGCASAAVPGHGVSRDLAVPLPIPNESDLPGHRLGRVIEPCGERWINAEELAQLEIRKPDDRRLGAVDPELGRVDRGAECAQVDQHRVEELT